ncbi:MAG: HlyD family secretion protein, partial [Deltaproteobacteria bacterium]|nr:HlyD family secretion protein [Deltaproteobacteria bacterium]
RTPAPDPRIDSQLAPLRAAAEAQKERCRQLELLLGRLTLTAPFDGRVGEVLALAGDIAREGLPVVTVVDDHPRSAIAYVDQRWSGRVQIGDAVSLAPSDRSGPPRAGKVVALGAAIAEAPLRFRLVPTEPLFCREVFIALDEPAPLPGQAFNATFRRTAQSGAFPAPAHDAGSAAP